jgi:hypothetical protein
MKLLFKGQLVHQKEKTMKRKLLFMLGTILTISLCLPTAVYADDDITYSISDYQHIIQSEANQYGIIVSVDNYDGSTPITQDVINNGIKDLKKFHESFIKNNVSSMEISESQQTPQNNSRSMPVSRTRSGTFTVSAEGYGTAQIQADINAAINIQNGDVMYVNNVNSYQCGAYSNFKSWTQTGYSTSLNDPYNGYVNAIIYGRATFEITLPIIQTTGYTVSVAKSVAVSFQ